MGFTLKPLISSIHDACCAPNIPLIAHFIPATSVGLLSDFSGKPLSLVTSPHIWSSVLRGYMLSFS